MTTKPRLVVTAGGAQSDGPTFPVIRVKAGSLHLAAARAVRLLIQVGAPLYQRSGLFVHPHQGFFKLRSGTADGKRHWIDYPTTYAMEVLPAALFRELEKIAVWEKFDMRAGEWRRCDPNGHVLAMILAARGTDFPVLSSITTIPFILPDNSIVTQRGYHEPSGVYLALDENLGMPEVPAIVSFDTARSAADLLQGLLGEFPFVSSVDLAVAMSALITPVARKAMDVAPLHAISAPAIGTGKSYLTDVAAAIRIGSTMPSQGARDDVPGELDKGLAAAILRDAPMISIDNVTNVLSSPLLAQVIERERVLVRILGESKDVEVPNAICLFASGNNLRVRDDLSRRIMLCSLDRDEERPYQHTYEGSPVREVLMDRGRYVAACLSLARYGLQEGRLDGIPPLNSFEDWSRCVREPLIRLGYADCAESQRLAEVDDPGREELGAVLDAWSMALLPEYASTATIISHCSDSADLRSAVLNVAGDGKGNIVVKKLSNWLARNKGKVCDGMKIVAGPKKNKLSSWKLRVGNN